MPIKALAAYKSFLDIMLFLIKCDSSLIDFLFWVSVDGELSREDGLSSGAKIF